MIGKRRILIIIPSLSGGGAERVLINLLNLMNIDKYEIDLFIGVSGGILEKKLPKQVNVNFLFYNRILEKITYKLYTRFGYTFLFDWFGKGITRKYDVGISYLDSFYTEFLFHNSGDLQKKVVFIHSSYGSYKNKAKNINKSNFGVLMDRYTKVDIIISVAHEALKEFKNIFGEFKDMRVLYNPFNINEIKKLSIDKIENSINKEKINLIAVGSHLPVKGYEKLIQSCKMLQDQNIDFNLLILGSGRLKDKHQKLINDLNLANRVFLKGFVSNPYKWIKNSDIYVMTSEAEGLPTGLCEAIILHKPVLVTDVPGCREVINNGEFGLMVDNSIIGIFEGLKSLIINESKRIFYTEKSKERSLYFNDEVIINEYHKIFDD